MRWTLVLLAGCYAPPVAPASLGTRVQLGCVELYVARNGESVVRYSFENHCEHRVAIDLASVRVTAGGRELRAFDPRHEIVPLPLPALLWGRESIEYEPGAGGERLCVDVGGVNADIAREEHWLCM